MQPSATLAPSPTPGGRIASLDGLRGLAALVVLIYHVAVCDPAIAAAYYGTGHPSRWLDLAVHSPLHLLIAGNEAVVVFFVLSGVVLTLPFLGARPPRWSGYYPSRLVRLYLPVWGALLVALVLYLLVARPIGAADTAWLRERVFGYDAHAALGDWTLEGAGHLISPLWSLRFEMIFSMLLPAYLWVALRWRRHALVLVPVTAALAALVFTASAVIAPLGQAGQLLIFAVGVLLAVGLPQLRGRLRQTTPATPAICGVVGLLLVGAPWWLPVPGGVARGLATLAAALLIVAFVASPGFRAVGESRPVQQLGRLSFSLYLIHEPIVLALRFGLPHLGWGVFAPLAVVASLLGAAVFHRLVEAPSHRLARRLARRDPAVTTSVPTGPLPS